MISKKGCMKNFRSLSPKTRSGEFFKNKKITFLPETHFKLFFIIFGSIERPILYVIFVLWVDCKLGKIKRKFITFSFLRYFRPKMRYPDIGNVGFF